MDVRRVPTVGLATLLCTNLLKPILAKVVESASRLSSRIKPKTSRYNKDGDSFK